MLTNKTQNSNTIIMREDNPLIKMIRKKIKLSYESNNNKSKKFSRKEFIEKIIRGKYRRRNGLNDRQVEGLRYLINHHEIDNYHYQLAAKCERRTASRDLTRLVELKIIHRLGKGRGTYYILQADWIKNRT